jgi:hypothetical protein
MLVCKPIGRGNWARMTMAVECARLSPITVRVGHRFQIGGVIWRICEVRP